LKDSGMCIQNTVGAGGDNERSDVVIVQILLNYNKLPTAEALAPDGRCGKFTIDAIREFQARQLAQFAPDGRVDPGGRSMAKLREGLPPFNPATALTADRLLGIMPLGQPKKIAKFAPMLQAGMVSRQIDTARRQAHFLAQVGHESLSLIYTEEIASGAAYEGRTDLGNTKKGDGKRFKGRGLIQLTGRFNYRAYGQDIGVDLTKDDAAPKVVGTDPRLAADVACWFWQKNNINVQADADDVVAVTRKVNGGTNGLADRKAYLLRARYFLC
jgi:putative chitinase